MWQKLVMATFFGKVLYKVLLNLIEGKGKSLKRVREIGRQMSLETKFGIVVLDQQHFIFLPSLSEDSLLLSCLRATSL